MANGLWTMSVVQFPSPDYWMVERDSERILTPTSPKARAALIAKARIHARGRWRSDRSGIVIAEFECVERIVTSLLAAGFEFALSGMERHTRQTCPRDQGKKI